MRMHSYKLRNTQTTSGFQLSCKSLTSVDFCLKWLLTKLVGPEPYRIYMVWYGGVSISMLPHARMFPKLQAWAAAARQSLLRMLARSLAKSSSSQRPTTLDRSKVGIPKRAGDISNKQQTLNITPFENASLRYQYRNARGCSIAIQ